MNTSGPATDPRMGFPDMVGNCIWKQYLYASHSIFSSVLEFFVVMALVACGLKSNYSLRRSLMEEKKNKPIGRKGNVIEPIVGWYCIIQSVFWPYLMLMMWIFPNQVVTWEDAPSWCVYIAVQLAYMGRTYIAFNSLCCAGIRYWFIVHQEKANQWDYEKTGRKFQFASVFLPLILTAVGVFVMKYTFITTGNDGFEADAVR